MIISFPNNGLQPILTPDDRVVLTGKNALRVIDIPSGRMIADYKWCGGVIWGWRGRAVPKKEDEEARLAKLLVSRTEALKARDFSTFFAAMKAENIGLTVSKKRMVTLIKVGGDYKAQLWDLRTLQKIADLDLPGLHDEGDSAWPWDEGPEHYPRLGFSKDGESIFCWEPLHYFFWDAASGACTSTFNKTVFFGDTAKISIQMHGKYGPVSFHRYGEEMTFMDLQGNDLVQFHDAMPTLTTYELSPERSRVLEVSTEGIDGRSAISIHDMKTGKRLAKITCTARWNNAEFASNDRIVASGLISRTRTTIFRRVRPEQWWGVVWLWQFWLCVAVFFGCAGSLWCDRSNLRGAVAK
jgi:hypothetical protein